MTLQAAQFSARRLTSPHNLSALSTARCHQTNSLWSTFCFSALNFSFEQCNRNVNRRIRIFFMRNMSSPLSNVETSTSVL